jgi:hypothetical protein
VTAIGDLQRRKRVFRIENRFTGTTHLLSIVVATLVPSAGITAVEEKSAVAVLGEKSFQEWAAAQDTVSRRRTRSGGIAMKIDRLAAGPRARDIRDPCQPKGMGYIVPSIAGPNQRTPSHA